RRTRRANRLRRPARDRANNKTKTARRLSASGVLARARNAGRGRRSKRFEELHHSLAGFHEPERKAAREVTTCTGVRLRAPLFPKPSIALGRGARGGTPVQVQAPVFIIENGFRNINQLSTLARSRGARGEVRTRKHSPLTRTTRASRACVQVGDCRGHKRKGIGFGDD